METVTFIPNKLSFISEKILWLFAGLLSQKLFTGKIMPTIQGNISGGSIRQVCVLSLQGANPGDMRKQMRIHGGQGSMANSPILKN